MESIVQDHEQRILELEKNYNEVKKEITVVQTSQAKIENMIYKQNTEQRELINKHQKEQSKMFNVLLEHTLGIKKVDAKEKWKLAGVLVGSGGLLYAIFEFLQRILGG